MSERGTRTAARPFYLPLKSSSQKLATTTYAPTWPRDTGRYDSSERLPDIEALFDRTLNQIRHIHEVRQRNPNAFDQLWERVCQRLEELNNASAYAHWKQHDIIENSQKYVDLDTELGEAWEYMLSVGEADSETRTAAHRKFSELQAKRAELTAVVKGAIDDALEVAIAYWIEARNAHNNQDNFRAFHCLIESHFFLGITYSPKTDYEAKSDAGKKAGKKERDALADAILDVMNTFIVDKSIRDEETLRGKIFELIQDNPGHREALVAFNEWATKGKSTENSLSDRFSETLRKWATGKNPPYPLIVTGYKRLHQQMRLERLNTNKRPRKANG
ncbi:hypothetical protein [Pseudoxanthomonas mexicana]|uniref:hypothetical protein n=1 Tax=Pseudoxanthomonas mexicana TaxID=128785 RepID=UPI0020A1A904|nr:hypothetical protein [Pseudoxanthomonas mexicana]MCP1582064.1 hypothetical protein [Pseudoxanthomonas mexicana]